MSYNWAIPVNSLLNTLQKDGYTIVAASDGVEWTKFVQTTKLSVRRAATDILTSGDIGYVNVEKDGKNFSMFIVLGNEPEELVADYTSNDELEATLDKYIAMWEGKKCPTE
jgi:hypothetical protein